ncbi:rod shape-determining protein MreC [Patescibacteria group bacterium]|nr:rod shape-determining protein MreC [Patescibacteria group bacterium]
MNVLIKDLKILLLLIFLSLLILLMDLNNWLRFPKSILQTLTVPIQYGFYSSKTTLGRQFEFISLARFNGQQVLALKQQLADLTAANAQLGKELSEAKIINDQQNYLSPQTYDLLPARVLYIGRFLTIDQGSDAGMQVGQVVVLKNNYIGQIKNVSPKSSQVMLEVDPDSKVAVFSQNQNGRARGILLGQFGSDLLMDKILHQENIAVGDLVYSEGTEGNLPRGLVMGKVSEVLQRQNEVFKQAKVEQVYEAQDLDLVYVIKSQ